MPLKPIKMMSRGTNVRIRLVDLLTDDDSASVVVAIGNQKIDLLTKNIQKSQWVKNLGNRKLEVRINKNMFLINYFHLVPIEFIGFSTNDTENTSVSDPLVYYR